MEHREVRDRPATSRPTRDAEFLIFKRRRFRASKACYPCRRRKVKCNLGEPCDTCVSRRHPDICEYTAQVLSGEAETGSSESLGQPSPANSPIDRNGGLYVDPLMPYTSKLHVGLDSLPQLLFTYQWMTKSQPQRASKISSSNTSSDPQTIFEVLCLQDSSTNFPFTNLWNPEDGPEKVYNALPEDEVIFSLLRFCQGSIFRILPSIIHFTSFEAALVNFLNERAKLLPDTLLKPPPSCTTNWFGLLFSILACGIQLSSGDGEDVMKARVFGKALDDAPTSLTSSPLRNAEADAFSIACCSFQCLRLSNFISFPTIEVVQTLIMLVNFLRNQADAGASWALLGLTIRLAQTLGLHCSNPDTIEDEREKDEALVKHYIWRALLWQDTLVSLCYDRPPGISVLDLPSMTLRKTERATLFSFSDSCHHLFVTANRISQALIHAKFSRQQLPLQAVLHFKDILNQIESQSVPHIQDVSKCQNRDDCIEHYFFKIFADSVMLCLCRPAVLSSDENYQPSLADIHVSRSHSILNTYMELVRLDCPIRRSWIFIHVTLSCALSVGMAAKDSGDARDRHLLRRFVNTLSRSTICANVSAYENSLEHLQGLVKAFE